MKPHRRFLALAALLVLLMAAITPAPAFSTAPPTDRCTITDVEAHVMTQAELTDYYTLEKGLLPAEAEEQATNFQAGRVYISTLIFTVHIPQGPGYDLKIGCRVLQSFSGGRSDLKEILDSWVCPADDSTYVWTEFTHSADITGDKRVSIHLYARVTIDTPSALLSSLRLPPEMTFRELVDLDFTYTLPGYEPL